MSKDANPGELRTPIYVNSYTSQTDSDGYKIKTWANVFGKGNRLLVKWVNLHGSEAWEHMSLGLKEPATLTSRYTPLITETCRILKVSDKVKYDKLIEHGKPDEAEGLFFEVISFDNVDERCEWMEIRVKRTVPAR